MSGQTSDPGHNIQSWPDDVLETAAAWKKDGRDVAIATVVHTARRLRKSGRQHPHGAPPMRR